MIHTYYIYIHTVMHPHATCGICGICGNAFETDDPIADHPAMKLLAASLPCGICGTAFVTEDPSVDSPPINPPIKLLAALLPCEKSFEGSGGASGVLVASAKVESAPNPQHPAPKPGAAAPSLPLVVNCPPPAASVTSLTIGADVATRRASAILPTNALPWASFFFVKLLIPSSPPVRVRGGVPVLVRGGVF